MSLTSAIASSTSPIQPSTVRPLSQVSILADASGACSQDVDYDHHLRCRLPHALELPEILAYIGKFLSQRDALNCVLVSRSWHAAFQPVVWAHVETANDISAEDMISHAHYIRSLSLADLTGLDGVLEKCTRLETLILWPDAFEGEEDEEDISSDESGDESERESQSEVGDDKYLKQAKQEDIQDKGTGRGGHGYITIDDERGSSSNLGATLFKGNPLLPDHLMHRPMGPEHRSSDGVFAATHDNNRKEGLEPAEEKGSDMFRRDSGVGEASETGLGAAGSLQVSDAQSHQQRRQQKQNQRRDKRVKKQKPNTKLTSLLIRNRNLSRIEVYVERKSPGGSFWRALAASRTIKPAHILPFFPPPSSLPSNFDSIAGTTALTTATTTKATLSVPRHCPNLSAFQSLVNLQVYKHIKPFLKMCTRLESLDLQQCSLRQLDEAYYRSLHFPRLKEVKFGKIFGTSLQMQLLILRQCPRLASLDWRVPRLGFPVKEFCEALSQDWEELHSLILPDTRLNDSELGAILRSASRVVQNDGGADYNDLRYCSSASLFGGRHADTAQSSLMLSSDLRPRLVGERRKGLTRFEVRRSDFASQAFSALKESGHFRTLKYLDLYQCSGLESWMVAEILRGCPLLESFDGHQLLARDIVNSIGPTTATTKSQYGALNNNGNAEERGEKEFSQGWWACREIKYLDIHMTGFAADPQQDLQRQWKAFAHLGKLKQLVHLSVGGRSTSRAIANPTIASATAIASTATSSSFTSDSKTPSYLRSGTATIGSATSKPMMDTLSGYGGLDLRLRSGLSQLSELKRLRMIRFTGTEQEMGVEDVIWMLENWPELKVVQGRMHPDEAMQARLEQIMKQHQVSVWSVYNPQSKQ
ncbi:hypothetical protein BX616_000983 [Lobosporangium transversale]|uniref:F-box domain-containing protein n=1 Tax=Lobosporangium transversale TaxID=64571 RepID=A0A1Y2GWJ5_9FUNG|nr:hypothetical protein BCR41DRAFT_347743 [Lobosporangium transversale]KAF9917447.1 hypothetical protein BX616_000983 [Lobosporangium transversale]ORZ26668.1 hypothetical protein BCR41DRAFT_347743 [Lobosporangium transversale]|eukprot:XP_021884431.1 hypothetical protein BCR41DRAFT_347743 [Lobosporangium transversale]